MTKHGRAYIYIINSLHMSTLRPNLQNMHTFTDPCCIATMETTDEQARSLVLSFSTAPEHCRRSKSPQSSRRHWPNGWTTRSKSETRASERERESPILNSGNLRYKGIPSTSLKKKRKPSNSKRVNMKPIIKSQMRV